MGLTRKLLKGMGLTDEQVDTIIEAHTDVVEGLKDEINSNKDAVKKLAEITKERDELKAQGDDGYKEKYDKEHSDFEKFKAEIAAEKAQASKEKAYRDMLKDVLSERGVEKAVKYADWSKIELDEKGKLKNAADHVKAVKEEWAEHVSNSMTQNAPVANPPTNTGGAKTKADIYKKDDKGRYILSTEERQKALVENQLI